MGKQKKEPNPVYKSAVDAWYVFYRHHTREEYVFSGRDGMHLKQLLKKIRVKTEARQFEPTDENILNGLKGFLNSIKDPWIIDHLDLSIVNSKFNVLYVSAVRTNPFTSGSRIDDLVEKRNRERTG